MKLRRSVVAAIVALLATLAVSHFRSTPYNNYVLFADALLHGRLWIDWPGAYIDAVAWNGHRYIVNDPLPGLLMVPFVAVAGAHANQTLLAVLLCGVACGAAWELCERLGCDRRTTVWLCTFFLCGTTLLWCSMLGDVWFIAQTSAVACMTLALVELAGRNRTWLVLLLSCGAIASRFTVVMALPVVAYLSLIGGLRESVTVDGLRLRRVALQCAAVVLPAVALWASYNVARWGVPWDSGHTIFYHQDAIGNANGSPFSLHNVPYQLWSFFVQAPDFSRQFPWIRPSFSGVALTWTAPAYVLALFAWQPRRVVVGLWLALALAIAPSLLYYVNGFAQYGMRHSLDVMPFAFVLMIFATRGGLPAWSRVAIAYSCAAGLYGVWYWNMFVRPGN